MNEEDERRVLKALRKVKNRYELFDLLVFDDTIPKYHAIQWYGSYLSRFKSERKLTSKTNHMPRFTFNDAKEKIAALESQLQQEIKDKKIAIQMFEDQGNKNTVTLFQLVGWSAAAWAVGFLIGLLF